jgi:protein TonB
LPAVAARLDESRLPSADVPLLVDVAWYDAKDLDLYPHPLAPVRPAYPTSAPDVSGEVTLLLLIDEAGAVHQLSVVAAEPSGYFEEPALRAFQAARFAPALSAKGARCGAVSWSRCALRQSSELMIGNRETGQSSPTG